MYKEGDYIVCLPEPKKNPCSNRVPGGSGFNANYFYKVGNISNYSNHNYQVLWNGKEGLGIYDNSVRYATSEEIEEYERLGKPFDTSTFEKFTLPENWYIVTTEESNKDVLDYFDEKLNTISDRTIGNFLTCKNGELKGWMCHASIDEYANGCTEITYQQFKKYVLKQSEVKHKYLTELLEKLKVK